VRSVRPAGRRSRTQARLTSHHKLRRRESTPAQATTYSCRSYGLNRPIRPANPLVEPFRAVYRLRGMWRSILLGLGLSGVLAGCSLGGGSGAASSGSTPSGSTPTTVGLSLVAQESPALGATRRWTTTRRISLTCSVAAASGSQSGQALCDAVAYYAHHVPTQPCIVRGVIVKYRRVEITGSLDGQPVHLAMGLVCNPAPRLSRAVQTIYLAAFR
jgi:hypothetical protein